MEPQEIKNEKENQNPTSIVLDQLKLHFFNPTGFGKHLTQLGFDLSKLSQVKKETIKKGEEILINIAQGLNKLEDHEGALNQQEEYTRITKLSDEFYTVVPHLPTTQQALLDKKITVDSKFALVRTLYYVLDAFTTINKTQASKDFLVNLYNNLIYNIQELQKDAKDYDIVKRYGNNNSRSVNGILYPVVQTIFKCTPKEETRQKSTEGSNKTLLWFGDRICSYSGILSGGFQYKERIVDGGEAFFCFSDSVIKAMSSCYLDRGDRDAFLLLCEVALGEILDFPSYEDVQNAHLTDSKTVRVLGKMNPVQESNETIEGSINVPLGKLEAVNEDAKILYNNYLVYDSNSIKLKYIVKFEIKSE